METIKEAKAFLRANFNDGVKCPCCAQMVKLYKRKIHYTMAVELIRLYKLSNGNNKYFHYLEIRLENNTSGDFAKLAYWGFIEEQINESTNKKTSGSWRITTKGKHFVKGLIKVPSHAHVYDAVARGFSKNLVGIEECIGKKFNYKELMEE